MIVKENEEAGVIGGRGRFRLGAGELEVILAVARMEKEREEDGNGGQRTREKGVGLYLKNWGRGRWFVRKFVVELKVQSGMYLKFKRTVGSGWRPKGSAKVDVVLVYRDDEKGEREGAEDCLQQTRQRLERELEQCSTGTELVAAMERRWRVADMLKDHCVKWAMIINPEGRMMAITSGRTVEFEEACDYLNGLQQFLQKSWNSERKLWKVRNPNGDLLIGYDKVVAASFIADVELKLAQLIMTHVIIPWSKNFEKALIPEIDLRLKCTEDINLWQCFS